MTTKSPLTELARATAEKLPRFNVGTRYIEEIQEEHGVMGESQHGNWVRFSDVEAALHAALRVQAERDAQIVENLMSVDSNVSLGAMERLAAAIRAASLVGQEQP